MLCEKGQNKCEGKDKQEPSYAWVSFNVSPYGLRCLNGCQVAQTGPVMHATLNPNGESYVGGTHKRHELMKTQYFAVECNGDGQPTMPEPDKTAPPEKAPPPIKKKPPCADGEGVLTSSSGTVACVPEGTVEARKPVISKDKKTEVFPDTSTKTTETTKTTDPATSATHTSATTTATPKTDGTPGEAGTPGNGTSDNSSSKGDGNGDGGEEDTGDFCSKNPNHSSCRVGDVADKGQFGSNDDKVATARKNLSDKFNAIKSEASGLFGTISGGAGSLPCPAPVVILGKPISFCFTEYQNELSVIGQVVMLIAAIASAFIIFRR